MTKKTEKNTEKTFLDLDRIHADLDDIFLGHQEALVMEIFPKAAELLETFESGLRIHMRHEEELLLPIYEARRDHKSSIRGIEAEVFTLEHRKMLAMVSTIRARLYEITPRSFRRTAPRDIIALLDYEHTFKHLVQHHNMREHNILYPSLDQLVSGDEREALVRQCTKAVIC